MTVPQQEVPKKDVISTENKDEVALDPLEQFIPKPPDGGWGWMVVFASFMIHVLADGFTYTFGLFYVSILEHYGVSKYSASWIASILVGVTLGSGPVSGSLVNRYGCRVVTIGGAIMASISLFISIYANSVYILYLTIGIGTGFGFGLIYLPAIVSVTSYFEKKRSFATGIAVCGSGLGTFLFSPFIEYLIYEYSWKGALVICSGVMLNCAVFGALFRPLEIKYNIDDIPIENDLPSENNLYDIAQTYYEDVPKIEISSAPIQMEQPKKNFFLRSVKQDDDIKRVNSHQILNPRVRHLANEEAARMSVSQPLLPRDGCSPTKLTSTEYTYAHHSRASLPTSNSWLLYRKDIFYRGSLHNIQEYRSDPNSYRTSVLRIPDYDDDSTELEEYKVLGFIPCPKEMYDTIQSLMGWNLLTDYVFLLFVFSNFCTSIGFNAPYIFIVDRALELGVESDEASYLLSIVGISNTASRVILGYLSDKPYVNRLYLYNMALTVCGIGTVISIWFTGYVSQVLYAVVFGSSSGAYVGLTSVVLVDLLGMEKLTNAFGLLLMFQGIASLIGPPLCGSLYDMSKSYDYSFALAGVMIAVSGIVLFLIPCAKKMQLKSEERRRNDVSNYA